jgi:hypothetical protein
MDLVESIIFIITSTIILQLFGFDPFHLICKRCDHINKYQYKKILEAIYDEDEDEEKEKEKNYDADSDGTDNDVTDEGDSSDSNNDNEFSIENSVLDDMIKQLKNSNELS